MVIIQLSQLLCGDILAGYCVRVETQWKRCDPFMRYHSVVKLRTKDDEVIYAECGYDFGEVLQYNC